MTTDHGNSNHSQVSILIDKKEHKSPTPTTGAALYSLGNIASNFELFREIPGKEDEAVPNDSTPISLKNGEHFFSTKKELNPG